MPQVPAVMQDSGVASMVSGIMLPGPGPALPLRSSVTNLRWAAEGLAHAGTQ